eukprot:767206-Hanusia_phi.AAC.1
MAEISSARGATATPGGCVSQAGVAKLRTRPRNLQLLSRASRSEPLRATSAVCEDLYYRWACLLPDDSL